MIPVNDVAVGAAEAALVAECVASGWISSSGSHVEEFERAWAGYCGRRHGVAVCNGTAALEAALLVLDLQPGDEVVLPTFTIISCVGAVLQAGAVPVLVDADPQTWCMDVPAALAAFGPRTRAVMPVHIYGHPVDLDPLLAEAERRGLAVVEDAAEAHGAEYRTERAGWQRAGSFGALSTFSFFANKLVTTGEGGMVLTDDDALAERLREVRNLGFGPVRFSHERLGRNYRLTNLQAALALPQIERMAAIVERKRALAARYREALGGLPALELPVERPWARNVYWMFGLVLSDDVPFDARELAARLRLRGVETRPFFLGMHEQPALRRAGVVGPERFPVAERLARRGLYLPSGLGLTEEQQAAVCEAIRAELP